MTRIKDALRATGKPSRHVFDMAGIGVVHTIETTEGIDHTCPAIAARCVEEEDVKCVCALRVTWDKRWELSIAMRTLGYPFTPADTPLGWHGNMRNVTSWVTDNYGSAPISSCGQEVGSI